MALAFVFATVVVKGGKPRERRRLFAADATELRHADDERERSAFADAGNAQYQIEPSSEIGMIAQLPGNQTELSKPPRLQSGNVGKDNASQSRLVEMLEAGLQPGKIFFGLLDEGQQICKLNEALIRSDPRLLHGSRTGGNQNRVECIVLGSPEMEASKGAHLDRLQHQHRKPSRPQISDHAALVTAGRFDSDPRDPGFGQLRAQAFPALQ